jgi:hypothetical protein
MKKMSENNDSIWNQPARAVTMTEVLTKQNMDKEVEAEAETESKRGRPRKEASDEI